ncbi:hypothetical protein LINPERHAP2_LOCUS40143, partial [Linum perenne]
MEGKKMNNCEMIVMMMVMLGMMMVGQSDADASFHECLVSCLRTTCVIELHCAGRCRSYCLETNPPNAAA